MLETLFLILAILIIAILLYASTRPSVFHVERSAIIKASPEKVFALINDLHGFNSWNPWLRKDPSAAGSYTGASSGKGAAYAWESGKVGTGRMEIIESVPSSNVKIKLDFLKPFEGHNTAEFLLAPNESGTQVTWSRYGPSTFMSKVMGLFFSMDKMVGTDFEAGLANMKELAER